MAQYNTPNLKKEIETTQILSKWARSRPIWFDARNGQKNNKNGFLGYISARK